MDGPIIKNAQEALDTDKIDLDLMLIQKKDEAELKQAFQKAREVRKLNPAAKELADQYFLDLTPFLRPFVNGVSLPVRVPRFLDHSKREISVCLHLAVARVSRVFSSL